MKPIASALIQLAGWAWTAVAGGGGLCLLFTRGPWPPTNGWFALASGLVACPLLGWALKRYAGANVSMWQQLGAALFFYIAGHAALWIWPHS
jgi:hypothetical protein